MHHLAAPLGAALRISCLTVPNKPAQALDLRYDQRLGAMPDTPQLRPAPPDEIADALSFALRYQGRKRVRHADELMARITAERLIKHLTASAFVVMMGQPTRRRPRPTCRPPGVETSVCWSRNFYRTGAALCRSQRCRPSGWSCRVAARNRPGRPGGTDSPFFGKRCNYTATEDPDRPVPRPAYTRGVTWSTLGLGTRFCPRPG
jgi:hypothetical protein